MKNPIHEKGPFQKTEEEAKILTEDEYFKLSELLRQFAGDVSQSNLIDEIEELYIERFSLDSKVAFYFNNWSKTTTQSDSYMNLILYLRRLSELVSEDKHFLKML